MKKEIALAAAVVLAAVGTGLAFAQDTPTTGGSDPSVTATPSSTATPGTKHHHHHKENADATPTPTGN
jgi:hypothetical protein